MLRPDVKTPRPGGARGAGEAGEADNLRANRIAHGRSIARRYADSIRLQAIGQFGGA